MEPTVNNRAPDSIEMSSPVGDGPCGLCLLAPSRYTCPRCNVPYCSLNCYRGGRHRSCSETFYRDEVLRGLQEVANSEGRKGDIEGILKRMREAQLQTEEEDGLSLEDSNTEEEESVLEEEHLEGASPLYEDTDTTALWKRLTPEEQKDFQKLLETGALGALVTPWLPWWESHENPMLVQEIELTFVKQQNTSVPHSHTKHRPTKESQSNVTVTSINEILPRGHLNLAENKDLNTAETKSRQERTTTRQTDGHNTVAEHWTEVTSNVETPGSFQEKAATVETRNGKHSSVHKDMSLEQRNSNAISLPEPIILATSSKQRLTIGVEGQQKDEEAPSFRVTQTGDKQTMEDTMMLGVPQADLTFFPYCRETEGVKGQEEHCDARISFSPKEKNNESIESQKEQCSTILEQSQTPCLLGDNEAAHFQNRVNGNDMSWFPSPTNHSTIPLVPKAIPPLNSLTRSHSPLVKFSLVNILYAYAFSLKLYNGDLNEDFILQEFCDVVLGISSALSTTKVFSSTAEALQAGIQAVLARGSHNDPQGGALAVAHILMGRNISDRQNYTLAALSHLAELLAKARKLVSKEKKQIVFNAKKKCQFLLSWANENKDALTLLSVEVQTEYKSYIDNLKEVELLTHELKKSWGGSKPPEKKSLIQELD